MEGEALKRGIEIVKELGLVEKYQFSIRWKKLGQI